MKIIFNNNISAVTADEENANFPDDNVSNDSIRHVWKATSEDASIVLNINDGSDNLAVFGTNATSITVTITDLADVTIYGPTVYTLTDQSSIWSEYTYQSVPHKAVIDFSAAAGTIIEAGIVRAGFGHVVKSPEYGLNESYKDHSIVKELNNGATFVNTKPIVRTFSGTFKILRDGEYAAFMRNFVDNTGAGPLPWLITDINDQDWSIFARINDSFPSGSHNRSKYTNVSFNLIEMV